MALEENERNKAVEIAVSQIERQFGKGSIMRLGSRQALEVPTISTSALSLDAALGIGGVPRGRVVEIFGPESSGKTTLALHVVAEAQRAGAPIEAAMRADELAEDGDMEGRAVWLRIMKAIEELLSEERSDDTEVH